MMSELFWRISVFKRNKAVIISANNGTNIIIPIKNISGGNAEDLLDNIAKAKLERINQLAKL